MYLLVVSISYILIDNKILRFSTFTLFCRWKEIKHDNTVTWLAFWNDPINPKEFKYVFLAASSSLKGQSDKEKYEKARLLKVVIRIYFFYFVGLVVTSLH